MPLLSSQGSRFLGKGRELPFPTIADLVVRYRADTGLWQDAGRTTPAGHGNPVGVWDDLSGNELHATQSSTARPVRVVKDMGGTFDAVVFDGTGFTGDGTKYMLIPSGFAVNSKAFTSIAVHRHWSKTLQCCVSGAASGSTTWSHFVHQTALLDAYVGASIISGTYYTPAGYCYSIVQSGASATNMELFGQRETTGTGASATSAGGSIGSFGDTAQSYKWVGALAEIIVFSRVLDSSELARIRSYLASRYRVATTAPTKNLVIHGNSISAGAYSSYLNGYPWKLANALPNNWKMHEWTLSGKTTATMITEAAAQVDKLYNAAYAKNILYGWEGTNHLQTVDATTAYNSLVTYYQARQAAGWTVVAGTIPIRNSGGEKSGYETDRQAVNASMRANWQTFASALVDWDADARFTNPDNRTYFSDGLHFTDAGHSAAAEILKPVIEAL